MASPSESITTVNGRRCTRSRARTAAVSTVLTEEPAVVAPTQVASSTTVELAQQLLTTDAVAAQPPQAESTIVVEQPAAAPTTEATEEAATLSTGTSTILSIPENPLAALAPSAPPAQGQGRPTTDEISLPDAVPTVAPVATSTLPTGEVSISISSNPVATAIPTLSTIVPPFTAPAASEFQSVPDSDPVQPTAAPDTGIFTSSIVDDVLPSTSGMLPLPSGGPAGVIAPDNDDGPLTLPNGNQGNIATIVGGVIGGVACLAMISGLFFFCLRKRKTIVPKWIEKDTRPSPFVEKAKAVPAAVGTFFAKIKGYKAGPLKNPYRRHEVHTSVSSVYSNNGLQGFAAARRGSVRSNSSKKSERNVLRKKSSISSNYQFPAPIDEKPIAQSIKDVFDPFADPESPKNLKLLNPDPRSTLGPVTPLPAVQPSKDPFASILDDLADSPAWLQNPAPTTTHQRTRSSAAPPRPHPPSSVYTSYDGPIPDTNVPPVPSQAAQPNQKRRSSFAFPSFNQTSSAVSRDSQYTMFGEPGPSRPGTNLFTPGVGRTVRQSDPFDLDRPEVLGFGNVLGRKEVRGSVTRNGTVRSKRSSSIGGWISTTDGPYGPFERDSAKPYPLRSGSTRSRPS